MPTIIDSLLVKLGLDSSDFVAGKTRLDKGLKDTGAEADKTGSKLKKSGKDAADGFDGAAKSAAKFLAVVGGVVAIKRFVETQIEANSALDRFAQNLNASVEGISAWSNAAELAGGSASGLQGTMDMLSKSQTELMLTGQSSLIPYFAALGMSLADAQGKARPVSDILLDLSERFGRMDRTTANNMGRMMGIDQGTMQLLLKGRSEVELMLARQRESGVVTKRQAEEASRLRNSMIESRQSFEAFGRELLSEATPALEKMLSVFASFGAWVRENKEFVQTFLTVVGIGLAGIAAATIPINLTAVAILGLSAGIAALWDDYQTWRKGGDSFFGDDWKMAEAGISKTGDAVRWLKDLLGDLIYRAIAAADVLAAVFARDWKRAKFAAGEFINGTGKKYGAEAAPAPQSVPQTGDSESKALAYFQAQGWSKEQSAGIVANLKRESSFNTAAIGDNGQAYGLAQWHPDRQAEFQKHFGKSIKGASLEDQLAFVQYELTQGNDVQARDAGVMLKSATRADQAAAIVSKRYERPADREGEASRRGQIALAMLGGTPGASQAAAGAGAVQTAQASSPVTAAPISKSVETHIGEVKVYSAATDAAGIAQDMGKSLDYLFTSQANYGLM